MMSTEQKPNRLLPDGWHLHVTENFVSAFDHQVGKFADQLERKFHNRIDAYPHEVTVSIPLLVPPPGEVLARGIEFMRKRGLTVTRSDASYMGSSSLTLNVCRALPGRHRQ